MATVKEKIMQLKEMGFGEGEIIRILEMNESELSSSKPMQKTTTDIPKFLRELGVPVHIMGYDFLKAAVEITAKKGKISATKELYPEVAKIFETTPSRVERAIRHAIEVSWDRGDIDTIYEVFGNSVQATRGKPTNSEFIAAVAEYVRNNR